MASKLIIFIPLLPLVGFFINGFISMSGRRLNRFSHSIACAMPVLAFILSSYLIYQLARASTAQLTQTLFTWVSMDAFTINFSFMIDNLTAVMLLIVTGVGALIHIYSIGYMHNDDGYARYFAYLNLFLFFMLLLILGDNLLVLFVGWEGVGLCSYLLIGFWFSDTDKAACGKKAFVVNRIGDFAFLIGIFYILHAFLAQEVTGAPQYFDFAYLAAHVEVLAPFAFLIGLCLFIGATGKSAQIPLYVWLPDAMAGPTPVSALIHAATMVTAGIYMVARLFFLFSLSPLLLDIIAGIGVATAFLAALIAITQYDIKKVLAYSTVSQLGYMFLALGASAPHAAIFHVVTHAFFKACLFMGAGSVIHALHHEQDIRKMGGLAKEMPLTSMAFLAATIAIAGIPPFAGFFSKDEILWSAYQNTPPFVYWLAFATAGLTAFYMFRLFMKVFTGPVCKKQPDEVPTIMSMPVAILACLAVIGGFLGMPEALGGNNWLHHLLAYLNPTPAGHDGHHATELTMMALSAGLAIIVSSITVWFYGKHAALTQNFKLRFPVFYQLMSHKFYVDELYDRLIIRPIHRLSDLVLWRGIDEKIVDGFMVHGWSDMCQLGAWFVSRLQSGLVSHYLLYLWIGLAALILSMV